MSPAGGRVLLLTRVPSFASGALPHIPRPQSGPETADVPIEGHATKRLTTASQFYQDDEK